MMTSAKILFTALVLILMAVILPLSGSHSAFAEKLPPPGELVRYKLIGAYAKPQIDSLFKPGALENMLSKGDGNVKTPGSAENAVKAYLVEYSTANTDGKTVAVSGLLLVPDPSSGQFPVLSYQHGTIFERRKAPSYLNSCSESILMLHTFAAHGYVVSMPDYIGLGRSPLMHPYLVAGSEASSSLDMLKASKQLCAKLGVALNGTLFLAGYSQGGHSTMALQRLLETEHRPDLPVTASAPMAGPYNLYMLWSTWIGRPCYLSSAVMAKGVLAYNNAYNLKLPMGEIFRPPYDGTVATLLDGNHREEEIIGILPRNPAALFTRSFLKRMNTGNHPFYTTMKANNTYEWYPEAPTTLYHGMKDDVVPYKASEIAYYFMKRGSDKVRICNLGDYNHMTAFIPALFTAKGWFDSYR
ncbi:MAG: lipase family protein [Candidatus Eremiobacteraeota bacterium]|nr:lipase family protein [Candidatus Eremiobacteraeota bacterium]